MLHGADIIQDMQATPGRRPEIERNGLPRKLFPALAGNAVVYLNSGGSGPPPRYVLSAMREAEDLLCGPAYLEGAGLYAHQKAANERARRAVAGLVGASPDDIALTQNTTHGINLGVLSLNWREGDEVLSTTTEHPGCLVPLHNLSRRFAVKIRLLSPPMTPEKIEAALAPRTRLIALSHVDWTSGEVVPLAEICAVARERGVLTLVDGAQSVGNIAVDVPATGADLYAFTGHKWLLGPEGMGALYIRPGLDGEEVFSPNVGYAALQDPADFEVTGGYELRGDARRFEASTPSPTLSAGLAAAAEAATERGAAGIEGIRARAQRLTDLLLELPGVRLRSPQPARSGLVSFEIESLAAKDAVGRLLETGFVLRYIPEPHPYVRASTHLFNELDELEALAEAVAKL